ncbi:FadR/GntR family transcriptional regulator [Cellulomonas sp. Root137]|uniref:FadR/GntR family transcriptional regulator n=1 Tax=Cellulomonas sp. Root137 TaxID=1736459 RepID=UPI0006F3151B|nr:FadR/GntR family transcriptional regulator [Cellulomonas sp. Root137]KQY46916.1 GntR family transcriptional regulator [Cellulomonas sp. Root137]KRD44057.1 GntR family transcriptional regulator [Cellulomonas sp. Root930]
MSRSDDVVDGVKQMILDGRLQAGERLPAEKELAATLGVSRGSLREGVRALGTLGILDSRHGDGTYVTTLDPALLLAPVGFIADLQDDASAFHAVRRLLETEAAGLAALHIDDDGLARLRVALDETARALVQVPLDHERLVDADLAFHEEVARASGNPVLAALIEGLAGRASRTRLWRGLSDVGAEDRTFVEHEAILAAVAARDPDRARLRMATHLLGLEDSATGARAPWDD